MGNNLGHRWTKMVEMMKEAQETLAQITTMEVAERIDESEHVHSTENSYIRLPGGAVRRSSQVLYSIRGSNRIYLARSKITDLLQDASKIQ